MNTPRGFSSLILIALAAVLLAGVAYWYFGTDGSTPSELKHLGPPIDESGLFHSATATPQTSSIDTSSKALELNSDHPISFVIQSSTGIPEKVDISPCPSDSQEGPYFCFGSGYHTHPSITGKSTTLYEGLIDKEGGASYGVVVTRPNGTVSAYEIDMTLTEKYTEAQYQEAYKEFHKLVIAYLNL